MAKSPKNLLAFSACLAAVFSASVVDIISKGDDLTQLAKALGAADLVTALSGPGPFTVLAPTDDAFEELGKAPTGAQLKKFLLNHVISGKILSKDLKNGQIVDSLGGEKLKVVIENGKATIGGAKIEDVDKIADNGVVHTLEDFVKAFRNPTIKPTAKPILLTAADIVGSNSDYSTLAMLLKSQGLVDTLDSNKKKYTVFVPTNEAFEDLDMDIPDDQVKDVLLYHVVEGTKPLVNGQTLTTLQGGKLKIEKTRSGEMKVNGVDIEKVIKGKYANIYVIDEVLIPGM